MLDDRPALRATLIGVAHGGVACAIVFTLSDHYTLAKDWFLALLLVFICAGAYGVAARSGANLTGVTLAGGGGLLVGGWIGFQLIGDYVYRVPVPEEERVAWITTKDGKRKFEFPGLPTEEVKRVPVGGPVGMIVGWVVGAALYVRFARDRTESEPDSPPHEPGGA